MFPTSEQIILTFISNLHLIFFTIAPYAIFMGVNVNRHIRIFYYKHKLEFMQVKVDSDIFAAYNAKNNSCR